MKSFIIPEEFFDLIRHQALNSEEEIYGWLIGYLHEKYPRVLALFECQKFQHQSIINAIPDVREFYEISSILPQGIGAIGIYHSHPHGSKVFHSHTDDSTLLSLSNQFPNCISVVTNGNEVECFIIDEDQKTKKIDYTLKSTKPPSFIIISLELNLKLLIDKEIIKNNLDGIYIKISDEIRDYLELVWEDFEFYYQDEKLEETIPLKTILKDELNSKPIKMRLSDDIRPNSNNTMISISPNEKVNESEMKRDQFVVFQSEIDVKVPIYISSPYNTLSDLTLTIKTELISNNILNRIIKASLDFGNKVLWVPNVYHLWFFGFYISLLTFNDKELNKTTLSELNYKIITRLISLITSLSKISLSENLVHLLSETIRNIKSFSLDFHWKNKIAKKIRNCEKSLTKII
ncbi:MAG: hypothetical protein GF311_17765 [Candidatus Lokiarchaeota archaeon]|nr:hypothetical protein [Candidatus Lokiarchaeota archaeon]